ncbi:5608533f-d05e-4b31-8894-60f81df6b7b9 [Sclerotinia trifoliorum]|uniref:5608533f-d05e-4b31-8894-60f81df6b7b9 n=1 Tax=Sclerotinia trifoliorum TaxID=28548 RepID=A0A8H2W3J0_9HELO|nr:5608533f-d05e-4b31-8894-60f81df6b7b9 [Sclerotinia trifoliorum]
MVIVLQLDEERRQGCIRSPLYGIPVFIKDSIATSHILGMDTIVGSYAPEGFRPSEDVDLTNAGPIILAKSQLSCPGGSSTGSAAGVSAIYASVALGTDTTRSIVISAIPAALYSIRVTTGDIDMDGVIPFLRRFNTIGPMAKCVKDVADMLDIIIDPGRKNTTVGGFTTSLSKHWRDVRIGVLATEKWFISPSSLGRSNPKAQAQMV